MDEASLLGSDGNPLLVYGEARAIDAYPESEEDQLIWSMEFAGRTTEKAPMIPSDGSGIEGKKLIMIGQSEHPYWTAIANGFTAAADFYGADLTIWNPNGDLNQQNQYIDMAIAEQCDMIFLATLDATASEQQFKKIYDAGIPCIAFNMVPSDAAMQYVIGLTGPDDFGQFEMLADYLAEELDGQAGVCYLTHLAGGSPYYIGPEHAPYVNEDGETVYYNSMGFSYVNKWNGVEFNWHVVDYPLDHIETWEDFEAYDKWVNPDHFDYDAVAEFCKKHKDKGVRIGWPGPYQNMTHLINANKFYVMMGLKPDLLKAILTRHCDSTLEIYRRTATPTLPSFLRRSMGCHPMNLFCKSESLRQNTCSPAEPYQ